MSPAGWGNGEESTVRAKEILRRVRHAARLVYDAANEAYPADGAPPSRPGLGRVTPAKAARVREEIQKELGKPELSNGPVFMAEQLVAEARALLGRHGERFYAGLPPQHGGTRNEWHRRPNDWKSVRDAATWDGAVVKFCALTDKSAAVAAEKAHLASGRIVSERSLVVVAKAVIFDGCSVIAAAKLDHPGDGVIRQKIAVELELAEHDLLGGRVFMAAHRVARAQALVGPQRSRTNSSGP